SDGTRRTAPRPPRRARAPARHGAPRGLGYTAAPMAPPRSRRRPRAAWLTLLIVLAAALALAACGGDDAEPTASSPSPAPAATATGPEACTSDVPPGANKPKKSYD